MKFIFWSTGFVLVFFSCQPKLSDSEPISPGGDPNFTIVKNTDPELDDFNRKVVVFGVDIYAAKRVEDKKLLHAANIMAQYLDNDEDGAVDNPLVLEKLKENNAFMVMWKTEDDFPDRIPEGREGQDLGNDETKPEWHTNGQTGRFDASLEEIWHIITFAGYSQAYPDVFGEDPGTAMTQAMDVARGGQFMTIPDPYPAKAWYSYDDETCDYQCMATEYFYWTMTSILGAQKNRLVEIDNEWRLNTRELMASGDTLMYQLLTDSQYTFPTVLPDGSYRR